MPSAKIFKTLSIASIAIALQVVPASAECNRLCDAEFWQGASWIDVQSALNDGETADGIFFPGGTTPLHKAASSSEFFDVILFNLFEAGGNVNAQDSNGNTPLMLAVNKETFDATDRAKVQALFDMGADPGIKNNDNKNAWNFVLKNRAVYEGLGDIGRLRFEYFGKYGELLGGGDQTSCDLLCDAEFMQSAGYMDVVQALKYGEKANGAILAGNTPLHWAAIHDDADGLLMWLLTKAGGQDVINQQNDEGNTALVISMFWRNEGMNRSITSVLLAAGANPKIKDAYGETVVDYVKGEDFPEYELGQAAMDMILRY